MKHKIWWYHWISCWILSKIKFKNLFLTEMKTKLWHISWETSILTNWVWGLFLGVYLFMSLRKKLINWLVFQLGKCFYTFPYIEFNEKMEQGTPCIFLSPRFLALTVWLVLSEFEKWASKTDDRRMNLDCGSSCSWSVDVYPVCATCI